MIFVLKTFMLSMVFIIISFTNSLACEIDISTLAKSSEEFEKMGEYGYFIKSDDKWFHLTQDKDCWIKITAVGHKLKSLKKQ